MAGDSKARSKQVNDEFPIVSPYLPLVPDAQIPIHPRAAWRAFCFAWHEDAESGLQRIAFPPTMPSRGATHSAHGSRVSRAAPSLWPPSPAFYPRWIELMLKSIAMTHKTMGSISLHPENYSKFSVLDSQVCILTEACWAASTVDEQFSLTTELCFLVQRYWV